MKAALHNLGCKVNAYETEAMQQILEEAGYEIVCLVGDISARVIFALPARRIRAGRLPSRAA